MSETRKKNNGNRNGREGDREQESVRHIKCLVRCNNHNHPLRTIYIHLSTHRQKPHHRPVVKTGRPPSTRSDTHIHTQNLQPPIPFHCITSARVGRAWHVAKTSLYYSKTDRRTQSHKKSSLFTSSPPTPSHPPSNAPSSASPGPS